MAINAQTSLERFRFLASRAGIAALLLIAGVRAALMDTGFGNLIEFALGLLIGTVAITAGIVLSRIAVWLIRALSVPVATSMGAAVMALLFLTAVSPAELLRAVLDPGEWEWPYGLPHGFQTPSLLVLVAAMAMLVGLAGLLRGGGWGRLEARWRTAFAVTTAVLLAASGVIVFSLASDGEDPYTAAYRTLDEPLPGQLDADNPGEAGPFDVERLSYGAGENRRRPEFGVDRDLESRRVDASALLKDWKGVKQRMREWYWGFGLESAPLNALVWTPVGDGPFPLVLIVHGNHGMEDYSDPGYAYLGELLASRGYIAVSVDENFINGTWSGDFRGKEMPLRAWFLLEHLSLWRDWNRMDGHRFAGKVDLENIALVGHSRGGEAVPIAYLYNDLPHYPDDATVTFDYGFTIKSLVAIAQVDQRYHRRVDIADVSFLALQGSYDSDEPAFHGLRQMNRLTFTDDGNYQFKAGLYIHGANHGQFNSTWGREDNSPPGAWLLNLAPIIPPEDQRAVAKVSIAAFLAATLKGDRQYLPLFRDPRTAAAWLPDHVYVNQFTDSSFVPIADFDDDLNVTTATANGAVIRASGFSLWREEELKHRDERLQGTSAVVLGWNEEDQPVYEISLPASFWQGAAAASDVLTFALSGSTQKPPKVDGDDEDDDRSEADDDPDAEPFTPGFTIESEDTGGRRRAVDITTFARLAPPLRVQYLKSKRLNKERYKAEWEPVLQVIEIPLHDLRPANDATAAIRTFRLRFDQTPAGVLIIDDIGLRSTRHE